MGRSQPGRVVVLRALQLGDLLCAVPAFRALRRAWPDARITLAGLPWARQVVERFGAYLDDFIEFPGYPGLPERLADPAALDLFLNEIRKRSYDLALQLHGDGSITNGLVAQFGARRVAGFCQPHRRPSVPGDYVEYPEDLHEIQRLLLLVERLGVQADGDHLEFPVLGDDERDWLTLRTSLGLAPFSYACLHPGARAEARRWPPANFAAVGQALLARGLRVLVTGYGPEEQRLADAVVAAMDGRAASVAGEMSLGVLAALVRDARLIVCNDTGLSHLAAAVATPSVAVFRVTDPRRWAPMNCRLHRVVQDGPAAVAGAIDAAANLMAAAGGETQRAEGTRCES